MIEILIIIAIVCLLFLLSLRGRSGHPALEAMQDFGYAHRGLHGNGIPENSMEAFRAALAGGYGIELDIHLMADGNLAVIHDASLKRTAGADVQIEDLTAEDLENYRLEGTEEKIPLFKDVMALYDCKAPMIVELKPMNGNHDALAEAPGELMKDYQGIYCMESFDPRCIAWLRKNRPQIIRGQLTENFVANDDTLHPAIRFLLTHNLLNFQTVPDFVAYKFADRRDSITTALCRKAWDIQGVSWTIKTQEDFDTAVNEGWLPIFEGFEP